MKLEFDIDGPGVLGGPTIAPFIVCEACGKRITDGHANALFEKADSGARTGKFVVVHRSCDPARDEWQKLPRLFIQLLHNAGYDLDEVFRDARRMTERERQWAEVDDR